jgi:hypothetical protein
MAVRLIFRTPFLLSNPIGELAQALFVRSGPMLVGAAFLLP